MKFTTDEIIDEACRTCFHANNADDDGSDGCDKCTAEPSYYRPLKHSEWNPALWSSPPLGADPKE